MDQPPSSPEINTTGRYDHLRHPHPRGCRSRRLRTRGHRNKPVFGDDVDNFRPERWLGPEDKVRVMQNTLFSFGHGKHACAGKNLARMELLKLVLSLMRRFEVSRLFHQRHRGGYLAQS